MKIIKRLKNLWALSEYGIATSPLDSNHDYKMLKKEVETVRHQPAVIVKTQEVDIFNENINDDTSE